MFGGKLIVLPNRGTDIIYQNTFCGKMIISLLRTQNNQCKRSYSIFLSTKFILNQCWLYTNKLQRQNY